MPHHCYAYMTARTKATGSAVKAGKEISLLACFLEYGRHIGEVRDNVAQGIEKTRNPPKQTLVTSAHIEILTKAGREVGGNYHIAVLARRFAWLTLRRHGEVLSSQINKSPKPAACSPPAGVAPTTQKNTA